MVYLKSLQPLAQSGRRDLVCFVLCAIICSAQANPAYPVLAQTMDSPSTPPYQQLRYNEDYSHLRDQSRRTEIYDMIKFIPLDKTGTRYLSIGGEIRERYEYFHNPLWGQEPHDNNGHILQRYMLHTDLHWGRHLRLFSQLKSGIENDRTGGPQPVDEDKLDLHQTFLEVKPGVDTSQWLTFRAGRQEIAFGSSRLVSVREGPNVRRSFDGLRTIIRAKSLQVDGFVTRPVETNRNTFDDGPDNSQTFWGIYSVFPFPLLIKGNIDFYYLGLNRDDATFEQGTARELRHSVGTRLWSKMEVWDYNFEFVYQWGSFDKGNIQAWTAASDTGYTFHSVLYQPRLGLKANITSGDLDPEDPDLQTFNPLFPRGSYFGEIALIGPANHIDVHPSVDLHMTEKVTLTADWVFFWRESVRDGIYGSDVDVIRSGQVSRARYVGNQASMQVEWRVDRHITVTTVYSHFFAGPFLKESGSGSDVDYFTSWITYKF